MGDFCMSSVGSKAKQSGLLSRLDFAPDETNVSSLSGFTARTAPSNSNGQSLFKMPQRLQWHQQQNQPRQEQQPKKRQQQLLNCTTANMIDSLKSTIFSYLDRASTDLSLDQEMFLYIQMNKVIYDFNKEILTGTSVNPSETGTFVPRTAEPVRQNRERPTGFEDLQVDQHSTQILESDTEECPQNSRITDNQVRPSSSVSNYSIKSHQSQRSRHPLSIVPETNIKNPHKFIIPNLQDDYSSFRNKAPGFSGFKPVSVSQQQQQCGSKYPPKSSTVVDKRHIFTKGIFSCPDENNSPELKSKFLSTTKRNNSLMKKTPQINSNRLKNVFSERSRLDTTIIEQSKQIKNWTLKRKGLTQQVELVGRVLMDNGKPVDSRPKSVGTILSRKGDNTIKTTTGAYELIGNSEINRDLPVEIRQQFTTQFPRCWRKVLNDSGMLHNRNNS